MIVAPPGVHATDGTEAIGYHFAELDTSFSPASVVIGWIESDGNPDFSLNIFSHELAESISNPQIYDSDAGQYVRSVVVTPGVNWTGPSSDEVSDAEAQDYSYRLDGALVQSYWSDNDSSYIVPDGNAQYFYVNNRTLTIQGDQLPGSHSDRITLDRSATSNGIRVMLNGEVAEFEDGAITSVVIDCGEGDDAVNLEQITGGIPVTVNLGYGHDTVNVTPTRRDIGNLTATSTVTINGPPPVGDGPGLDTVNIYDQNNPLDSIYTIDNTSVSRPSIFTGFTQRISYNHIANLFLYCGTGNDTVDAGVDAGFSTTLIGGSGPEQININRAGAGSPFNVNLGGGQQIVNVSSAAKDYSNTILADVTVNPGLGPSALNVDDDHAGGPRHWTVGDGGIGTDANGVGVVRFGRLGAVNLTTGYHGNTVTVQNSIAGPITNIMVGDGDTVNALAIGFGTTVNVTGGLAPIVNVGNSGHMAGLHGLLHIDTYETSLNVDDSADFLGQNDVVVQPTSVTGFSDGVIDFADYTIASLTIKGSHGGSVYHVVGTPVPFPSSSALTTLVCDGTDTVNVGNYYGGNLTEVHSDLMIENPGRFTNLTIDAAADTSNSTRATITNLAVAGLSPGEIRFDQSALSALTIDGMPGGVTYNVQSLPSYFLFPITTTLNLLAGDTVNLGQGGSLQGDWGNGNLACDFSGASPAAHVVLDGSRDPAGAAYTIGGNGNLTVQNTTVGLGLTINGFRDQDQVVVDLPGGSVDADLTHTGAGSISLDGSARLLGINVAARLDATIHARAIAGTVTPAGPITGLLRAFNSVYLVGSMPQDTLHVFDSANNVVVANDPIPAPFSQFAATAGDPTTVTAGEPFDFTVVAQDATGGVAIRGFAALASQTNSAVGQQFASGNPPKTGAPQGSACEAAALSSSPAFGGVRTAGVETRESPSIASGATEESASSPQPSMSRRPLCTAALDRLFEYVGTRTTASSSSIRI